MNITSRGRNSATSRRNAKIESPSKLFCCERKYSSQSFVLGVYAMALMTATGSVLDTVSIDGVSPAGAHVRWKVGVS